MFKAVHVQGRLPSGNGPSKSLIHRETIQVSAQLYFFLQSITRPTPDHRPRFTAASRRVEWSVRDRSGCLPSAIETSKIVGSTQQVHDSLGYHIASLVSPV